MLTKSQNAMNKSSYIPLVLLLLCVASCAPGGVDEFDPCAKANSSITLDNLMRNSVSQAYERCLAIMRDTAATELRK
jgi:hypothetical protein